MTTSAPAAVSLVAALDRMRTTFRWKADGLDRSGLDLTIGASSLNLGGLLKHLTRVEDVHFRWDVDGEAPSEPWRSHDWDAEPDWDFRSAAQDEPADLYAAYDAAVAKSQAILSKSVAEGGLVQNTEWGRRNDIELSVGRLVADLLEEYGRHTGHADLLREAVDGRVGEDPPQDWEPAYRSAAS